MELVAVSEKVQVVNYNMNKVGEVHKRRHHHLTTSFGQWDFLREVLWNVDGNK